MTAVYFFHFNIFRMMDWWFCVLYVNIGNMEFVSWSEMKMKHHKFIFVTCVRRQDIVIQKESFILIFKKCLIVVKKTKCCKISNCAQKSNYFKLVWQYLKCLTDMYKFQVQEEYTPQKVLNEEEKKRNYKWITNLWDKLKWNI